MSYVTRTVLAATAAAVAVALLLGTLVASLAVVESSAGAATRDVWFLGLAQDQFTAENDQYLAGVRGWQPWASAPSDHLIVRDNYTGPGIFTELDGLKTKVKDGDILLVTYSGHSDRDYPLGMQADPNGDEDAVGSTATTRSWDEVMMAGTPTADYKRDDELATKLKEFPAGATKVVVLNTCYAGGYAFTHGTSDLQTVTNIAVLMSVPEDSPCPAADQFEAGLQDALLVARKADADKDGVVFAEEWYNVGKAFDGAADQDPKWFSNLDASHNVPIFSASPVGGIAQLPVIAESRSGARAAPGSGAASLPHTAMLGGIAAGLVALTAGAWYARRRWLR